jgi:hypothetical protein
VNCSKTVKSGKACNYYFRLSQGSDRVRRLESDRKLVFTNCKLVLEASRCCLREFWDQITSFEVIATIMLRIYSDVSQRCKSCCSLKLWSRTM